MHLSRLYDQVFVTHILRIFKEGTMTGLADIISAFKFSPHVVKQVEGNCSHCITYPPSKFRPSGSQWRHAHSILDVPPKEKLKLPLIRTGGMRWSSDRPAPSNPFLWKLAI
jgi:hypothetical protein